MTEIFEETAESPSTASETEAVEEIDEVSMIEEEGDIAADYLEELLDIVDLDGDIDIEVRNQRIYLSVVNDDDGNEDLRHLVGRRGEVLDALQELVRLKPLGAYERKVVHDVVAEQGLYSESEGEGTRRHVVISLPEA